MNTPTNHLCWELIFWSWLSLMGQVLKVHFHLYKKLYYHLLILRKKAWKGLFTTPWHLQGGHQKTVIPSNFIPSSEAQNVNEWSQLPWSCLKIAAWLMMSTQWLEYVKAQGWWSQDSRRGQPPRRQTRTPGGGWKEEVTGFLAWLSSNIPLRFLPKVLLQLWFSILS